MIVYCGGKVEVLPQYARRRQPGDESLVFLERVSRLSCVERVSRLSCVAHCVVEGCRKPSGPINVCICKSVSFECPHGHAAVCRGVFVAAVRVLV